MKDKFQNKHNVKENQVTKFQLEAMASKGSKGTWQRVRGVQNPKLRHSP